MKDPRFRATLLGYLARLARTVMKSALGGNELPPILDDFGPEEKRCAHVKIPSVQVLKVAYAHSSFPGHSE